MWNLILPHGKCYYSIINKKQDLTESYNIHRKNIPLCKLTWAPIIWETLLAGWAKTNLVIRENEWNSHCIYYVQCKSLLQNNLEGCLRKVFWLFHFHYLQELKKVTSIMFFFFFTDGTSASMYGDNNFGNCIKDNRKLFNKGVHTLWPKQSRCPRNLQKMSNMSTRTRARKTMWIQSSIWNIYRMQALCVQWDI